MYWVVEAHDWVVHVVDIAMMIKMQCVLFEILALFMLK
jgi:hypothetical protein